LLGHRQAFTWIDDWYGMTIDDVRDYEKRIQAETNEKLKQTANSTTSSTTVNNDDDDDDNEGFSTPKSSPPSTPTLR